MSGPYYHAETMYFLLLIPAFLIVYNDISKIITYGHIYIYIFLMKGHMITRVMFSCEGQSNQSQDFDGKLLSKSFQSCLGPVLGLLK